MAVLKRLPHGVKNVCFEFWKFIEKKYAVMCEADFPGLWNMASSNEARIGNRMVGRPERPFRNNTPAGIQQACNAVFLVPPRKLEEAGLKALCVQALSCRNRAGRS